MLVLFFSSDSDPRSWKSTLSTGSSGGGQPSSPASAAAAKEKRFSMNYLDTIGDTDPRSWQNTIGRCIMFGA